MEEPFAPSKHLLALLTDGALCKGVADFEAVRDSLLALFERLNMGKPMAIGMCGVCGEHAMLYTGRHGNTPRCFSCFERHMFGKVPVVAHSTDPIPMVLTCPGPAKSSFGVCGARHIDVGIWATKVHHTHSCQVCGFTWRPAVVPTVGVQFLPGFKNEV